MLKKKIQYFLKSRIQVLSNIFRHSFELPEHFNAFYNLYMVSYPVNPMPCPRCPILVSSEKSDCGYKASFSFQLL